MLDREAICVTLLNFFTGIFAGFAVFGFLGYLAWHMDTSVHDVVDSGIYSLHRLSVVLKGYIHFGPWSLRSSVTSVLGPKCTSISVFS